MIDEVVVPDLPEPTAEFVDMIGIRNRIETQILGTDGLSTTAVELWPIFHDRHKPRRLWVARVDGRVVARAVMGWRAIGDAATINVEVLDEFRRRGIGSALLATLEGVAIENGKTTFQSAVMHTTMDGPRLESPTGFGSLPAADPGVRFLINHGYALEQVARISQLDIREATTDLAEHLGAATDKAGTDYRVITWTGETPREWRGDLAIMRTSMSVEDPRAGMEVVEDIWTDDRVADHDAAMTASGRLLLTAVAEHVRSGRLAGFTEVTIGGSRVGPAVQEDTLVLPEHRGHRLGMLLKAANAIFLIDRAPGATIVTTFNAEENRPMLDVNEAIGFRAIGYEGGWQKKHWE